jgi:LCP family protein required for cell wall assembly
MSEKENKVTGTTEEFTIQALSEEGAAMPEIEKKKDVEPVIIDESFYNDDEIKAESQPEKKKKSKGKRAAKALISIICIILVIGVVAYTGAFMYLKSLSKNAPEVEDTMKYDFDEDETVPPALENDPIFETIYEGDATELQASIKEWATNGGDLMYDKDVINVLCIGVDTRNQNTISGLTDSMIIASINTELGTISFSSIMRDSYAYLEDGNCFNKINSAFPFYGVESLMYTIETHFKIKLDGYAMINFALFKAAIDELGGVDVPLTESYASYLNDFYHWDLQAGSSVTLNGDQALAYCRSRKCFADGDVTRTQNQRTLIMSLLRKMSTINTSEITDYVAKFYPYFQTSYSESEIIGLATKAVVGGWFNFSVQEQVFPGENARTPYSGSTWYWEVDYPLAAKTMQEFIYGKSNIELNR